MTLAVRFLISVIGLAFVLVAPASSEARPRDDVRRPRVAQAKAKKRNKRVKSKAKRKERRERIRQRIRAARQWKLTEALELDEDTADKLFPILDSFDDKFVEAMGKGRELRRELRAALDSKAGDSKVNGIVDGMLDNQRAIWKLNEKRFQAARKVLSAEQAAKALIVLPEVDRAIRRQMRKAMGKDGRGPRGRRGHGGGFKDPF
jgi:hypothetical protein